MLLILVCVIAPDVTGGVNGSLQDGYAFCSTYWPGAAAVAG